MREGGVGGAGVGGRRDSADDGNNFQRMSWRGKEKKKKRVREREEVDTQLRRITRAFRLTSPRFRPCFEPVRHSVAFECGRYGY